MPRYPVVVPTERQLKERAELALKQTKLFERVSRRLLGDLVEAEGLRHIGPIGADVIHDTQPLVLVVLEGSIVVDPHTAGHPPVHLMPGTYLSSAPPLKDIPWHPSSSIESTGPERARVFFLDADAYAKLPTVIVNAMDYATLKDLNGTL